MSTPNSKLLASALAGSWRQSPPTLDLSQANLDAIAPLLLGSGGAGLAWHKVRHSNLSASPAALQLQQAYRQFTLRAAVHERQIARLFDLLRSHGVEPILLKGWSIARLYPEPGLRPYGDIDISVPPAQYARAKAIMNSPAGKEFWVDLHKGFANIDDSAASNVYSRTRLVNLQGVGVRILSPEDQLRLICLHFLRHGAYRPLWLCDVAIAVETRPNDFDWTLCLGRGRIPGWVLCVLGLSHHLLGARLEDTPAASHAANLPGWLLPYVLKQWEDPYPAHQPPKNYGRPMRTYLRYPAGVFAALRKRWPNAITATLEMHAPINNVPRFPIQLATSLRRALAAIKHRQS